MIRLIGLTIHKEGHPFAGSEQLFDIQSNILMLNSRDENIGSCTVAADGETETPTIRTIFVGMWLFSS